MNNQNQNQGNSVDHIIQGELQQREQIVNIQNYSSSQDPVPPIPTAFQNLLKLIHLPVTKTPFCKHKFSCLQSIFRDSLKIACVSYLVKSGMSLVFGIKKIISNPINLVKILVGKDSINFGLFVGSFVLLFRSVLCIARRKVSQNFHRYIPFFAGLFGGLISILFLQKKSRQTFALFLFARAIDITYNNLVKKGYLPEFKYFYVVLYSLMMGITGYVYGTEPGSMSPEMNKFYLTFTNETLSDMQMRQIWIQRKNNYLAKRGIARQDPLEYMPKLKKYYQSLTIKK